MMTKNIPWIQEFPTDELKQIAMFSLLERGAYYSLKLIYHTNPEAFNSEQILFAMCLAFSDDERTAVRTVVERLFKHDGKIYPYSARLNLLEEKALLGISQKKIAGIKSGEARRAKRTAVRTISESESESESELKQESDKKKESKKVVRVNLSELSVDHIKDWLAQKRIKGRYLYHDEYHVLDQFKNYCESKGKKYENYIAGYRNAFEWDRCQPKAGINNNDKHQRTLEAAARGHIRAENPDF